MTEDLTTRRKRLIYQSHHRGTKENDLILGAFAQSFVPAFDEAELSAYENILAQDDGELFAFFSRKINEIEGCDTAMLNQIRATKPLAA
ncbi:MAG: succinate dehydrogenase assembly factor 2 [Dongiaceae bacterium]